MDFAQPVQVTAFDAIAAAISLIVSLTIAAAALARAPRDIRTRVFFLLMLTGASTYAFAILQWFSPRASAMDRVVAFTAAAFCVSCVATFHFTQVFPWRRGWIRAHGRWLAAAYLVPPLPVAALGWVVGQLTHAMAATNDSGSGGLGSVTYGGVLALMVLVGLPLLVTVGVVLPLAGLMSLVKSWREARQRGLEAARITTGWMLISQMAGGLIAILIVPLLHAIGIHGAWQKAASGLLFATTLLMP